MKFIQAAVAVSMFATTVAAMAVEATQWNPPAGSTSRSEVKSDLHRAIENGELSAKGEAYGGFDYAAMPASNVARAQVKQDLARARADGELEGRNEAYSGFAPHPHQPAPRALAAHHWPNTNATVAHK